MGAKEEIERRFRKGDYTKISKEIFDKNFNDLSYNEYLNLSMISDHYGTKYKKIFKFKNTSDIDTVLSNLVNKDYKPNFQHHNELKVIYTIKKNKGFLIYLEFFTLEVIWKDVDYNGIIHKVPHNEYVRRIMTIENPLNSLFLIISIDPTREGSRIYKEIDSNLDKVSRIINLDFKPFLDSININKAIFKMVDDGILIAKGVNAIDESTKRIKSVITGSSKDNIKDDALYKECLSNQLKAETMKMKYDKESLELYGDTLIKFSTLIIGDKTDEFTKQITSIL